MTSLFREILAMSVSAGFLVGIIIAFRWCFRRVPKWVHVILWGLVAVRLLFPSLPQSQLSMVPEHVSDKDAIVEIVRELPRPAPGPVEKEASAKPIAPTEGLPEKVFAPAAGEEVPAEEAAPGASPIPWMTILTWVWVAGMASMGVYAFLSARKILNLVGPSVNIGNGVYLCDYIDSPFLLGFRKPRIYMPSYLDTKTAEYVLAHERSHIRRRDHWWKPIGFILLSIHWFNPMIWLGYILLCRDIEMACDEAVIRSMDGAGKKGYSTALLTCSLPRSTVSICPLAFGEVSVKERIKSVLSYRKPALWLTAIGVAAVVLGAVFFLTNPKDKIAPEDAEYKPTAVYIADRDELTTYEYDKAYRVLREVNYHKGVEDFRLETTYRRRGNTLLRTVVCTKANSSSSVSIDGINILPGQTVTLVYEETLDENNNVLESVLTVDGEWVNTRTSAYNENGRILTQTVDELDRRSNLQEHQVHTLTYTYDAMGNLLNCKTVTDSPTLGQEIQEQKWELDENGNTIRSQYYHNGELIIDDQYTVDVRGRRKLKSSFKSDGSSVTYNTLQDAENLSREAVTAVDQHGGQLGTNINFYDERDNLLSSYAVGNGTVLSSARNYVGTDGFKSTGIPKEIYTEGKAVHANPDPYLLEEEVPYYPTAKYEQDSDTLTVYDYDGDFTLKSKSTYVGGYEKGTVQYKFATVPEERNDITALDNPGYSLGNLIYQQVNDKGQITQSVCYSYNRWHSTHRYSYDAFGNLESVEGARPERVWKIFIAPQVVSTTTCEVWFADAEVVGPAIPETDWGHDERNGVSVYRGMALADILLNETWQYSHEIDEQILAMEPMEYTGFHSEYNKDAGQRTISTSLHGKVVAGRTNTLDPHGNVLRTNFNDEAGNHLTCFNYLSRDGHQSRGIPEKVYPADFQPKARASYPCARFDGQTRQLTQYVYDKDYQLTGTSVWQDGRQISESSYRRKTRGNILTITEKKTEGRKKSELVYTKELDENGNVTKSTLYRDGAWDSTYLFKYFPDGGLNMVVGYNSQLGFRLLKDQWCDKIRYMSGSYTENDVPQEPVWLEPPEIQDRICEKWYLRGVINDKLYFHELGKRLQNLGEYHDDVLSWNGGGGYDDGSGNIVSDVQIRIDREPYTLVEGQLVYQDTQKNPLWININDNEWCAFRNDIDTYYNYISTDGTKKVAIPEDLYYDAAGEWLTSYAYTAKAMEWGESTRTMDYAEVDDVTFWFDSSIPEEIRQDCISATNRIYNALWADYEPTICVLADQDLEHAYVKGSTLYTTVRDFRSREYAADVITAANGEFTLYGLAYGYANFLCDKLGWQEAESTEFVMPQNIEAADLNVLCFDERYSSKEDIAAAKRLACWFTNTFLLREDKNNYHIRFWMSNDPEDMSTYVCNELAEYYAEMGLNHRPTQVLYARSGNGLDYIANVGGEMFPAKQSPAKDYAGIRAFYESKLPK